MTSAMSANAGVASPGPSGRDHDRPSDLPSQVNELSTTVELSIKIH